MYRVRDSLSDRICLLCFHCFDGRTPREVSRFSSGRGGPVHEYIDWKRKRVTGAVGALVSAVHTKPRFLNFAGEYAILYTAGRTLLPFKERGQSAFQHEPSVALTAARPIGNDAIIMATWSCFWPLWNGFRNFIRSHTETDVTGYPCTGPRILSSSFSNRTQKKHPSFFLPLPL